MTSLARRDGVADSHVVKGERGGHGLACGKAIAVARSGCVMMGLACVMGWRWRVDAAAMDSHMARRLGHEGCSETVRKQTRKKGHILITGPNPSAKLQLVVRRVFMTGVEGIVGRGNGKEATVDRQGEAWPTRLTGDEGGMESNDGSGVDSEHYEKIEDKASGQGGWMMRRWW
ncbi:hypothetical protein EDB83DRAFT_2314735 [Lactarius deliciosus]|nr:hypothetical protein EDB83DRAFT_2314735 [Lactarius deliciosus]